MRHSSPITTLPSRPLAPVEDGSFPSAPPPDPTDFPEPVIDKIRGVKLVALWTGLIGGSWALVGGIGWGLHALFWG